MRWTIIGALLCTAILMGMLGAAVSTIGMDGLVMRLSGDTIGEYGSAHDHLYFKIRVLNQTVDLSQDRFQLRADKVHFENENGEILHVHAQGVDIQFTLRTLGFGGNSSCISVGRLFCSNATHEVRYMNNGDIVGPGYELSQDDTVLVWYGQRDVPVKRSFFDRVLPEIFRPSKPGSPV